MRFRIRRLHAALLAAFVGIALLSCARSVARHTVLTPPAPTGPRIPHATHLDMDMACADCHMVPPKKEGEEGEEEEEEEGEEGKPKPWIEPGPPRWDVCEECHGEDDADLPVEKRIQTKFFNEDGSPKWQKAALDYAEPIYWSHHPHKDVECATCHGDLKTDDRVGGILFTMEGCIACHQDRGAPNECETCHPSIRQDTMPLSHKHLWRERHGKMARTALERAEGRCHYCHSDPLYCERCHQVEKPRSHNNLWRWKTHGVMASIDRTSCQVCHQTDFCVRCHEDTQPRSHRGLWARGVNRHCAECHFPISSNPDCVICHRTNPTHDTAPDQPATHVPGMNCRLCHNAAGGFGTPPLRHYDNGQACESCHQ